MCGAWNLEAEGEQEARPCGSCKESVSLPHVQWEVVEQFFFFFFFGLSTRLPGIPREVVEEFFKQWKQAWLVTCVKNSPRL